MALSKAQKRELKTKIAGQLEGIQAAITAEFRGMTVGQLTELRVKLRETKAEFKVFKSRIAKVSIKEDRAELAALAPSLKGPVGLVLAYGDAAAAAKVVLEYSKDKELFKVTGGVMEGRALSLADIKELASLPSREAMLGQIAGMIQSPAQSILNLAVAIPRQLAQVIFNLSEKKQ